jgi:hypothetical protein
MKIKFVLLLSIFFIMPILYISITKSETFYENNTEQCKELLNSVAALKNDIGLDLTFLTDDSKLTDSDKCSRITELIQR